MRIFPVQPGRVLLTASGPLKKTIYPLSVLAPLLMLLLCAGLCGPASGQKPNALDQRPSVQSNTGQLNADQVVQNLVRMNLERAEALQGYQSTRVYRLEYKGFPGGRSAEIVVNVKYRAPGTKEFVIVSEIGSTLLIDRVFKKVLQSEQEALEIENQRHVAINQENYEFTLIGNEAEPTGPCYVLSVKPRTKNKFLFQGRIWVDAEQFAVVRIAAEPAKNPSFWIKDTKIETLYVNVNDFWLPAHNHSATAVRLGGHADFSIEYKDYQVTAVRHLNKISSNVGLGR
jgi:tRNA splicing endonuclease